MLHSVLSIVLPIFACCFLWISPPAYASSSNIAHDLLVSGANALVAGDYERALTLFTQAAETSPGLAYGNRCLVHVQIQNYQAAVADCTQALSLDPKATEPLLILGLAHYHLGQYDDAFARYHQLLGLDPQDYRAHYNLGILAADLDQHSQAIGSYTYALATSPSQSTVQAAIYRDRGVSHMLVANYRAAIADLNWAITHNPDDLWARFDRGCAYHRSHDYQTALQDFSWVIDQDAHHAQAYFNRGMVYLHLGNKRDAIANLQLAAQYFQVQGDQSSLDQAYHLLATLRVNPAVQPLPDTVLSERYTPVETS